MSNEEEILKQLTQRFPFLDGKVRVPRPRRMFADVPFGHFMEVFDAAVKEMEFPILCTITGLDEGENLSFLYHLAKENGILLTIKTSVPRADPVIKTVTNYFPAAELYERELIDLLGAKVNGLQEGRRYPLPDDWPVDQHPLRKDWKPQQQGADAPGTPETKK
ncbi:MAG: NADH-quinone oxidoreductase subunit C [Endomicrobiales bacterium]